VSHDPRESQTHRLVQSHARASPWDPIETENWMRGSRARPGVGLARVTTHEKSPPPPGWSPTPRARVGPGSPAEVDGWNDE